MSRTWLELKQEVAEGIRQGWNRDQIVKNLKADYDEVRQLIEEIKEEAETRKQ